MNWTRAEKIANAVLYEGYILYPYRPSAVKNRRRWTFGGVYPRVYSEAQRGSDAWTMQTECLVQGSTATRIAVHVRFLHIQDRVVGALDPPLPDWPASGEPAYRPVPALRAGDQLYQTWQEAVERQISAEDLDLPTLLSRPHRQLFNFAGAREIAPLRDPGGPITGVIVREQQALAGAVEVTAKVAGAGLTKLTVRVQNLTPWASPVPAGSDREDAVRYAFVSTHTFCAVRDGAFVSLLDPPDVYREIAAGCSNVGTWPVLVGDEGAHDLLLSSPIILYDYPQIAPESPGDLFDGAEIDEILTLRILTMTDAEKDEMRQADVQGRALLERTESLSAEHLMKLHGTMHGVRSLEDGP